MIDNLEQLERDWPQPRPKDPPPHLFTWMNLAFAILSVTLVNLEVFKRVHLWHSRHPAEQWWSLNTCIAFIALQLPWLFALQLDRQIGKLAARRAISPDIRRLIRHHMVFLLLLVYVAFNMILISVESMLH